MNDLTDMVDLVNNIVCQMEVLRGMMTPVVQIRPGTKLIEVMTDEKSLIYVITGSQEHVLKIKRRLLQGDLVSVLTHTTEDIEQKRRILTELLKDEERISVKTNRPYKVDDVEAVVKSIAAALIEQK